LLRDNVPETLDRMHAGSIKRKVSAHCIEGAIG
jgi:hypothetical protein